MKIGGRAAWLFLVVVSSCAGSTDQAQVEFLHPDQFGVFESMTARRAAAQLRPWCGICDRCRDSSECVMSLTL